MKPKNKPRTWQAYIFMLAIFISPMFIRGQDNPVNLVPSESEPITSGTCGKIEIAPLTIQSSCAVSNDGTKIATKKEIAECLEVLSDKYKVPFVILAAVVFTESSWISTKISDDGGYGLMQITPAKIGSFELPTIDNKVSQGDNPFSIVSTCEQGNVDLAKTNWKYNLEVGTRYLLAKRIFADVQFNANKALLATDASILENWYNTLACYNGCYKYEKILNSDGSFTEHWRISNDPISPYFTRQAVNAPIYDIYGDRIKDGNGKYVNGNGLNSGAFPYQERVFNIIANPLKITKDEISPYFGKPIRVTLPGPKEANLGDGNNPIAQDKYCFWWFPKFSADGSFELKQLKTGNGVSTCADIGTTVPIKVNVNRVPFGSPTASSTTQTLTLSKGANVISTPFDTAGKTLAQVLNNVDIDAVAYNLTDLFNRNTTNLSNVWNQAMKAGDSYMIYAKKNTAQTLTGISKSLQVVSLKASSWNVIGTTQPVIPPYRSTVHDKSFYFQDTLLKSKQLFSEALQTGIGHFIYNKGAQIANFFTANEASQGIANGNVQGDMDANALLFASMSETEQRDFMQASLKSDMKRLDEILESQQMALAPTLQGVMTISQSGVSNEEVKFGFDTNATDYFDANLDVYVGTPVPGELYAYIDDPTANVTQSYKSVNTFKEWELYVRSASIGINEISNLNPVTLRWSFPVTSGFKPTTKIELRNAAGSVLVSDMRTTTSYSFGVSSPNTERRFIIRLTEGTSGSGSTGIDLTPANPLISTTQLFSGNAFKWTTDVCNIGTTALSQTISVGMYFSKDTQWDASDTEIDVRPISNVLAGACTILNSNANLPSSIAVGSYYMVIKTDISNQVSESSETNNTTTLATPITISTTPSYTITTKAESGRISLSPAQTTYTHGTYVRVQAIPETGYKFVGWEGSLSGATNPTEVEMNGNKYIVALFAPIISSTGVDLRAEILSVPSGAYAPGASPNFNGKICNIGTVNSTSVATHVLVLSEDRYWGANDTIIGSFGGTIMAGNCQSWSFVEKIPTTLPNGTYWVLLVASYDMDENEPNLDNNIGTTASTFTITNSSATTYPQADIQFGDGVIPYTKLPQMMNGTSLKSGETISVTSDICVTGLGQINKSFKYRLWLSQDQVLDNTDTFLHWSNTLITFRGSIRCKMALNNFGTIPQGLSGKYNVILVLDADNEIAESNESNNRMIWEVDINAPSATTTQTFSIANGWSIISGNVIPSNLSLDAIFAGVGGSLKLAKNNAGNIYMPDRGINTIGNWNPNEAYKVFLGTTSTFSMTGSPINPATTPIALEQGWNLVPYNRTSDMSIATALANLGTNVRIAKNNNGEIYMPSFGINTIQQMKPNEGYQLYLTNATTLTYPSNEAQLEVLTKTETLAFTKGAVSSTNATLILKSLNLNEGAKIEAISETGKIIGIGEVVDKQAVMTIWGDDPDTSLIEGAKNGEPFSLRVANELSSLPIDKVQDELSGKLSTLIYKPDAVWSVILATKNNIVEDLSVYPNPNFGQATLNYRVKETGQVNLTLFDLQGRMLKRWEMGLKQAGDYTMLLDLKTVVTGLYVLQLSIGDMTTMKKLIVTR